MQFRVYDRQTLAYKDGGYVASYTIDDDYIVNNNSTIKYVKEVGENVVVGDTIALIQTNGAYHKGTITNVDNADFTITYKGDRELFNDNMLNPLASVFAAEEELTIASRFGIESVAYILETYFGKSADWAMQIPLKIITEGDVLTDNGEVKMLWNWNNSSINVTDWLISLFERYNVSLNWDIDFNISNQIYSPLDENGKIQLQNGEPVIINERNPIYVVTLSALTNGGKIIKDNVANQTITYTEKELPEATVCVIIDKETKEVVLMNTGTKNLLNPHLGKANTKLLGLQYGGEATQKDDTSTVTSWIKVEGGQYYTFSCYGYDNTPRIMITYNEKKNPIQAYEYNMGEIAENIRQSWSLQLPEEVHYIKITYANMSANLQFEKNTGMTKYEAYNVPAIYYLLNVAGVDTISLDQKSPDRVFPVKTKIVEYEQGNDEETTPQQVAEDNLIPSRFNQAIEIRISSDSKMFDFETATYGDTYKIINEQGTIDSNYTGRKEESGNKWITLYFGLGRQNYTDLIQMRLRKAKYQVLYNQSE